MLISTNKAISLNSLIIKMVIVKLNINIPLRLLLVIGGHALLFIIIPRMPSVVWLPADFLALPNLTVLGVSHPFSECNSKINEANHYKRKRI